MVIRVNWFQKSKYKTSATESIKISGIIKTSYWKWAVAVKWDSGGAATAAISTATAEINGSGGGKRNRRQSGNSRSAHLFPPSFGLCMAPSPCLDKVFLLCWDVVLPRQILQTPLKIEFQTFVSQTKWATRTDREIRRVVGLFPAKKNLNHASDFVMNFRHENVEIGILAPNLQA